MIVLFVQTMIVSKSGQMIAFPIGVEDSSVEEFTERLAREQIVSVTQLKLRKEKGRAVIIGEQTIALGMRSIGTIRDNNQPVVREED